MQTNFIWSGPINPKTKRIEKLGAFLLINSQTEKIISYYYGHTEDGIFDGNGFYMFLGSQDD